MVDQRHSTHQKYDLTIDNIKSLLQAQVIDQKVKFEEHLMKEKEISYKLKVLASSLEERNHVLRDQCACYRERIVQLESETLEQQKENYQLNSDLDHETIKNV